MGLSEERLLAWVSERWSSGGQRDGVLVGPGDDMAVMRGVEGSWLVAADPVVEGVHFAEGTAAARVGRKAVHRNLSDVAAMGAVPVSAVCCVAFSDRWAEAEAEALLGAMADVGEAAGCPVVGGDVSVQAGPTVVVVTVTAASAGVEPVLRSGARLGDGLYVSGRLGGSLMEGAGGYVHHLDFEPRVALGRRLAGDAAVRPDAMMDLSDGLVRDLPRLLKASGGLGAEVELGRLPIREAVLERDGAEAWRAAIGDGEDYELLMASAAELPEEIEGVRLTRIGEVTAAGCGLVYRRGDGGAVEAAALAGLGWEHRGG
ncbi:thiamine-phosphate kinase [Mucisphaera sp.]|uniref:thiamine-phosphate kinase n=1 Tax=Mucisphaera sp. TaxID=2913024 RepID=UPI003D0E824C